jgi:hypothetical protein
MEIKDNGFEELVLLKYLDANALKEMGVLLAHQGKLLERMQEIARTCSTACLNAFIPSYLG